MQTSKQGTFLFYRDFMEYHSDRFQDYSLLIFKDEKLIALLPANKVDHVVYSHQGLTYGGLVYSSKLKFSEVMSVFYEILKHLSFNGIRQLILKKIPSFYTLAPNDELDYLLFLTGAKIIRTDINSVIDNNHKLDIQSNRLEGVKKGKKQNLIIEESSDFKTFWNSILIPNLKEKHKTKPVHTFEEIEFLAHKFPNHIHQFNVLKDSEIVAGATVFETKTTAHIQYISANKERQRLGSLDFLFEYLINHRFKTKDFFDFGISSVHEGKFINKGLLYWKESFGARSIAQNLYAVETSRFNKLKNVFI